MAHKVYTRGGDRGKTGVYGKGRVSKNSTRIECLGTVDEANSTIGLLRAKLSIDHQWQQNLHKIQKDLMDMMSHLAMPSGTEINNTNPKPVEGSQFCENWIEEINKTLSSESDYFLLPGGNEISALCHVIRTQMRRAERRTVALMEEDPDCVEDYVIKYINRLSDLFFVLAREEMDKSKIEEERWNLFLYKKK